MSRTSFGFRGTFTGFRLQERRLTLTFRLEDLRLFVAFGTQDSSLTYAFSLQNIRTLGSLGLHLGVHCRD
ncbi:hypothetical protein D3C71_2016820 [compost metagenome]